MVLDNITNNLVQNDKFRDMVEFCQRVLDFNLIKEASAYIKNMEPILNRNFKEQYPNQYKIYYNFLIKFKFLTLNRISPEKLADFFENHWIEQYDILNFSENTFIDLFYVSMMMVIVYEDRDAYKKKISVALESNNQILIEYKDYESGKNDKFIKLTVSDILKDFHRENNNQVIDIISIGQYLDKVQKKYKLTTEDRNKILRLLDFYRILNESSLEPAGVEEPIIFQEDNNDIKVLNKGTVESILNPNTKKIVDDILALSQKLKSGEKDKEASILLNNYKLQSIDWTTVMKVSESLIKIYNKATKFQKLFHQAINNKNQEKIVATLYTLAHFGHLDEIFERDQKIKEIFVAHLEKKFSKKLAGHFEKHLREPVYLSYFLQHVLKDILKLSENESAVLAIKLVNELKRAGDKQYIAIAYGDLELGEFKWKGIVEKEDKLYLGR